MGTGIVFEFNAVTVSAVGKLSSGINSSKATGLDGINPRFLKASYNLIATPICQIINRSLFTGQIPLDWKIAEVSPLYKDGSRNEILNYRPISVPPVMGKVLERNVHDQTMDFFCENNLIDRNQAGFRSGHSTISCSLSVYL